MTRNRDTKYQDMYIGLVRLHVLHHAAQEPIFGQGMIQELGRHGYRLGPGTMYPLLHSLERRGWLKSQLVLVDGRRRKCYAATQLGKAALQEASDHVRELFDEIFEDRAKPGSGHDTHSHLQQQPRPPVSLLPGSKSLKKGRP
jgi:DNA-binding PadR family transcriptional regulator